jgi:glycosyltransferase involved in cell wall biosynthesis
MVTRDRLDFLKRSVACFCKQSYTDKELVIIPDGGTEYRQQILEHIACLNRSDIRILEMGGAECMGALRNLAIREAAGDLICIWDDDDLHHPHRLALQSRTLLKNGSAACLLADYLHYFAGTKELYWCDYGPLGGLPGTIMFRSGLEIFYPETGPFRQRGGDEAFQRQISAQHQCVLLRGLGFVYVYVCHGANLWNIEHHLELVKRLALPLEFIQSKLSLLQANLGAQLERELPVTLVCRGGERIGLQLPETAEAGG